MKNHFSLNYFCCPMRSLQLLENLCKLTAGMESVGQKPGCRSVPAVTWWGRRPPARVQLGGRHRRMLLGDYPPQNCSSSPPLLFKWLSFITQEKRKIRRREGVCHGKNDVAQMESSEDGAIRLAWERCCGDILLINDWCGRPSAYASPGCGPDWIKR